VLSIISDLSIENRKMKIYVQVFLVSKRQQIVDLYVEINKAQPVLEIDVPDVISSSKKRVIDQACAALQKVSFDCTVLRS